MYIVRTYTGHFSRKVAYTRYDVSWFIDWMKFSINSASRWICHPWSLPSALVIFMKNDYLKDMYFVISRYWMLQLDCEYVKRILDFHWVHKMNA
jgi:hypothetical protein